MKRTLKGLRTLAQSAFRMENSFYIFQRAVFLDVFCTGFIP